MDKRVPEVRFKGFTDDWEQHSLNDMAKSFMYGLNASSIPYDGVNKYLRITDIDDNSHKLIIDNLTSPNVKLEDSQDYLLQQGDILFARTGASVGKTYLYNKSDGIVFFAGFLIRMRTKDVYNEQFIFQNTLTEKYKNFVQITSQRSGQPGINAKEYSNFRLYIPTEIDEQNKVGCITEKLDFLIELHRKKLNLYRGIKEYMLQNLFPKDGENVPNARFADFYSDWEQKKLKQIGHFLRTNVDPKKRPTTLFYEYSMPAYDNHRVPNKVIGKTMKSSKIKISGNVLLINKLNVHQKRIWLVEGVHENSVSSGEFMPFYSNTTNLHFLKQLLLSNNVTKNLESLSSGTSNSQKRITPKDINIYKIKLPNNIIEQSNIGKLLDNIDHLILYTEKEISDFKSLKLVFLQKMFL